MAGLSAAYSGGAGFPSIPWATYGDQSVLGSSLDHFDSEMPLQMPPGGYGQAIPASNADLFVPAGTQQPTWSGIQSGQLSSQFLTCNAGWRVRCEVPPPSNNKAGHSVDETSANPNREQSGRDQPDVLKCRRCLITKVYYDRIASVCSGRRQCSRCRKLGCKCSVQYQAESLKCRNCLRQRRICDRNIPKQDSNNPCSYCRRGRYGCHNQDDEDVIKSNQPGKSKCRNCLFKGLYCARYSHRQDSHRREIVPCSQCKNAQICCEVLTENEVKAVTQPEELKCKSCLEKTLFCDRNTPGQEEAVLCSECKKSHDYCKRQEGLGFREVSCKRCLARNRSCDAIRGISTRDGFDVPDAHP